MYTPDSDEELDEALSVVRLAYESKCRATGLRLRRSVNEEGGSRSVVMKVFAPFERLCKEAEKLNVQMDLADTEHAPIDADTCGACCGCLRPEDPPADASAAAFRHKHLALFDGHERTADKETATTFFRPALRSLLTYNILANLDIRPNETGAKATTLGLSYLKMIGAYSASFPLHDSPWFESSNEREPDELTMLKRTWLRWCAYQPLMRVRNYFGERVALMFAWSGFLYAQLWALVVAGLVVFIFGMVQTGSEPLQGEAVSAKLARAFDNDLTPYYALLTCVWGTLFLELWKRRQATLAYTWDMNTFEEREPDRPEYYGDTMRIDPVSGQAELYYPPKKRAGKYLVSALFMFSLVGAVVASVSAVVIFRVAAEKIYFDGHSDASTKIAVLSAILNATSIFIFNFIYER